MSAEVWTWVMIAAVGHALWNAAARHVAGDGAVMWLSFALGTMVMIPPCIYMWWQSGPPILTEMALQVPVDEAVERAIGAVRQLEGELSDRIVEVPYSE